MDYKQIQDLIKLVKRNSISELEIEQKDFKISIRLEPETKGVQNQYIAQPMMHQQPIATATPQPQPVATQATASTENNASNATAEDSNLVTIKSPMIGTFYRAAGPDKDPYVSIGDQVEQGQIICMIEAMKLFNEIEAEHSGKIVKILVEDATPVEFDQPLFLIDPKA